MTGWNDKESARDRKVFPGCETYRGLLKAWLDGELDRTRSAAVERHVEACRACSAVAQDFREISSAIRSAGEHAVLQSPALETLYGFGDDGFVARRDSVDAFVEKVWARASWAAREEVRLITTLQRVASAAAALLVISLGLALWSGSGPGGVAGGGINSSGVDDLDGVLEIAISDPTWKDEF